jgi:hypothetical protein
VVLLAVFLHGPIVTEQVELNTFAPVHIIHTADWIMAGLLLFFIATNVLRMYQMIILRDKDLKIPPLLYITEAWNLVLHAFTQRRWATCAEDETDEKTKRSKQISWITHILLTSGYGLMLILIIFFLNWFQTDEIYPFYHPQRWLGYLAAGALIYGAGEAVLGRVRKQHQMHRFSHPSDWLFPILLALLSLSGLVIHVLRYQGSPLATYYAYVAHLAFMMMLYVTVGPMGKWAHLIYRPFAVYFQAVKAKAKEPIAVGEYSPAD